MKVFPTRLNFPLLLEAVLEPQEQTSLLSFVSLEHWVLITTDRLIWKKELHILFHEEIEDAGIDKEAFYRQGPSYKKLTQEIKISTRLGESYLVDIGESGGSLFAFFSVLGWIAGKKSKKY